MSECHEGKLKVPGCNDPNASAPVRFWGAMFRIAAPVAIAASPRFAWIFWGGGGGHV